MVLCVSHKSFFHLVANSMALASFGKCCLRVRLQIRTDLWLPGAAATHYLCASPSPDPDISGQWHFLAFFISGTPSTIQRHHFHAC